jgi:hypothetical protein
MRLTTCPLFQQNGNRTLSTQPTYKREDPATLTPHVLPHAALTITCSRCSFILRKKILGRLAWATAYGSGLPLFLRRRHAHVDTGGIASASLSQLLSLSAASLLQMPRISTSLLGFSCRERGPRAKGPSPRGRGGSQK